MLERKPRWMPYMLGAVLCVAAACSNPEPEGSAAEDTTLAAEWEVDFFDDFDRFDPEN